MKVGFPLTLQVVLSCLPYIACFSTNSFISSPTFSCSRPSHNSFSFYPSTSSSAIFAISDDGEHAQLPSLYVDGTTKSITSSSKPSEKTFNPNIQQSFDRISNHLYNYEEENSSTSTEMNMNKRMVRYGQTFQMQKDQAKDALISMIADPATILSSSMERVPGCIATVHVQSILFPITSDNGNESYRVYLTGTADALLSQGLLAILSTALSGDENSFQQIMSGTTNVKLDDENNEHGFWDGLNIEDVLSMDPDTFTDKLRLRNLLSPGRNDGLASMLRVVQSQIESLLNHDKDIDSAQYSNDIERSSQSTNDGPTVAMLLSGGVDSSVALNLLTRQNYNVTAFYLKIWLEDELAHLGQCPWEDDYKTCQAVCEHANIPLETISLQKEYKDTVIQYTVTEAKKGRTPNPDIMCNSRVKFGCFYDAIEERSFDYVATGHYAQLVDDTNHMNENGLAKKKMRRAPDEVKDQSYFLSMLTQKQLSKVMFPIGKYTKKEVRALAEEFDLPNKHRPESQGLCFLGKVKFEEFLGAYLGENPGQILDASSTDVILGEHKGLWFHTIGQRKGIGKLLIPKVSAFGPWYIVAKDIKRNALLASNQYDEEVFARARSEFYVDDLTWISGTPPKRLLQENETKSSATNLTEARFNMKIRHGPKIVQGSLQLVSNEDTKGEYQEGSCKSFSSGKITLDNKDGGLAPGQFVVFYGIDKEGDDDEMECLGAGVISERHWASFLLEAKAAETVVAQ